MIVNYFSLDANQGRVENAAPFDGLLTLLEMMGDLADTPQPESGITVSSGAVWPERNAGSARGLLFAALRRLESIEDLLLNPTPQHIQEAERLFGLVAEDIRDLQASCQAGRLDENECRTGALAFQIASQRVLALLNGALRIHWHRLRRMGSYHETYTAAGAKKVCVPRIPSLDLKM